MTGAKAQPGNITSLLEALLQGEEQNPSFGELLDRVGRRSFGAVILLLGFIAISPLTIVPGASWLVATVTLVFSLQMLVGMRHPWLPRKLLAVRFPRAAVQATVKMGRFPAHVLDKLTAPRLTFLTEWPFLSLVALACILAALVTYPLGLVPLGPVLPSLSIVLLGVGVAARDGAFLMLAFIALAGAGMILARWLAWLF